MTIATGTRLAVLDTAEGRLLKPLLVDEKTPLAQGLIAMRKRIAHTGPVVSIEDMKAAVLREATRRVQR